MTTTERRKRRPSNLRQCQLKSRQTLRASAAPTSSTELLNRPAQPCHAVHAPGHDHARVMTCGRRLKTDYRCWALATCSDVGARLGQRTFTSKLSNMLGTTGPVDAQTRPPRLGKRRTVSHSAHRHPRPLNQGERPGRSHSGPATGQRQLPESAAVAGGLIRHPFTCHEHDRQRHQWIGDALRGGRPALDLWADWCWAMPSERSPPVVLTTARTRAAWSRSGWVETCLLVVAWALTTVHTATEQRRPCGRS